MSKSLFIDFMEKMLAFPLWIKQTIFLNLSNAVEKCHDKKVVAPDLNFGNILYDRNTGKISYIDYDGLQIGRVPTNVINSDIFYKQNPVLRKSKYSAPGGLYSKEIDTFSILVLLRLTA